MVFPAILEVLAKLLFHGSQLFFMIALGLHQLDVADAF